MKKRGALTDEIRTKSIELLGYEINTTELRLMVHLQYIMVNEQKIDWRRINADDRKIINRWRKAGLIAGGHLDCNGKKITRESTHLSIAKEFWDIICEIIYIGYVDLEEEEV